MKELRELKYDTERWEYLQDNQDKGLVVMLDNDDTFINREYYDDFEIIHLDCPLGNSEGVECLLDLLGIRYRRV